MSSKDLEIYEKQRKLPFYGYSSKYLLITDGLKYSTLEGEMESDEFHGMIPLGQNIDNWIWEIDRTEKSDENGWYYAFCFSNFKNSSSSGKSISSKTTFVRRRRWIGKLKTAPAPVRNEFEQYALIPKTVKHAISKFKSLSVQILRPLYINITSAANLRVADPITQSSDPFVLLTVHSNTHGRFAVPKYHITTPVCSKTLNPTWNYNILLPSVNASYSLCFTVVDYDMVTRHDFLGQVIVNLAEFSYPLRYQNLELPLHYLKHVPFNPNLTRKEFEDANEEGQGLLRIEIVPLSSSTSLVGRLKVHCVVGSISDYLFGAPGYQPFLVVLAGEELFLYDASTASQSIMKCEPTNVLKMSEVSFIGDHVDYFELVVNGQEWRFKPDTRMLTIVEQYKNYKLWIKILSRVCEMDVQITAEAKIRRDQAEAEMTTYRQSFLTTTGMHTQTA